MRFRAKLAFAVALTIAPAPAMATDHAVVVGIDDYQHMDHLRGAVNDANDIAQSLIAVGISDVTLLTDANASMSAFDAAWTAAIGRAAPGDLVILTFSGHGIRVPENRLHTTPDGFEKGFLLYPYDQRSAPDEILRDEDLYDRFADATKKGIKIVFVADACHSGAAVRGLDSRGGKGAIRLQHFDTTAAPIDQQVAEAPVTARPANPDVTILSATDERLTVQEIVIDNAYRGALSYAFARGLSVPSSSGGAVTAAGLRAYVAPLVRTLSDHRQIPQFAVPDPDEVVSDVPAALTHPRLEDLPPLSVSVTPAEDAPAVAPDGIGFVDADAPAEIEWDAGEHQLIDTNGDPIASDIGAADLAGALEGRRVLDALRAYTMHAPSGVTADVTSAKNPDASQFFLEGDRATFLIDPGTSAYLALFDLNAHGTIQLLWPFAAPEPPDGAAQGKVTFTAPVTAPFGADDIVSVASQRPLTGLIADLRRLHDRIDPTGLYDALKKAAADTDLSIGINGIVSCKSLEENGLCG